MRRIITIAVVMIAMSIAQTALAGNTGISGFNGLFFRPNVDGQGILNVDTANTLYPGAMHAKGYFQYARRTISFSDPALGGLVTDLVENQVAMNMVLGVGLTSFLDIGMDIPIVLMQNGTSCLNATCSNVSNYAGYGMGDMRFVIKLRILKDEPGMVGLALASDIGIPTGNRELFTGGNKPSYEQRLIVSKTFKHVEVAGNIGYRIVNKVQSMGLTYDDSLTFGAGIKGFLPHNLYAYGTVTGNAFLTTSDGGTPVEFMGGVGHRWQNGVSCEIGGGARIVDGVTAADFRAMGSCGIDFGLTRAAREHLNPQPLVEWIIPMRTNQSRLKAMQKDRLDDVIRWLQQDRQRRVRLIGNADDRASYKYNMKLSTKRAIAARDYLFAHAVLPEQVIISTHGEAVPRVYGKTSYDRSVNRSVVVREVRN